MKVNDFLKLDKGNTLYRLIDGSRPGYLSNPVVICEYADRNIMRNNYGTLTITCIEAGGKNKILLYVV
jgi:hypothetical protein